MAREAEINLKINLDDQQLPERIEWKASDFEDSFKEAEAFTLSVWDAKEKSSLSIDLWTKAMTVQEMSLFYYQKLMKMSETFENSTGFKDLAKQIYDFAENFSEQLEEKFKKGK